MASPPFNINTAEPADDDVVNQFPSQERSYRDIVESWLLVNHDDYGRHFLIELPDTATPDRPGGTADIGTIWREDEAVFFRNEVEDYTRFALIPKGSALIPNASLDDMGAGRFKGRKSADGTGAPQNLTATEATAELDEFDPGSVSDAGLKGLVPAPAAGDAAANKVLTPGGWANQAGPPTAVISDVKLDGTAGGTFTQGTWADRDLVHQIDPQGIVSITAPATFVLGTGTYTIHWSAPGNSCGHHQTRMNNVTDTDIVYGSSESASTAQTRSEGWGRFTVTGNTNFKLQHRCQTTQATNGFGVAGSFGGEEVYSIVEIWKEG